MDLVQEYAESLAALSGNDFQSEVCARLQSVILGFQTVPANPHGDAGLDAFSHEGRRGYCCYGPEHDAFKTNKQRENAIVGKFQSDLRRLFELDFEKKTLVCTECAEMATILPSGQKMEHIELIVNWFDSHRILNPIMTAAAEYKLVSKCKYIDSGASIIVVGPKQLATRYAVDEITIARSRQRIFINSVKVAAQLVSIGDPKGFDSKMAILNEIMPHQVAAIGRLTEQLRTNWRVAIAFESKLDETAPMLHQTLEEDRGRILTRVVELMFASDEPWKRLGEAEDIADRILRQSFGKQYESLIYDISSGEIARLIGECPIGWEAPTIRNA